jgi:hypothetical protein
VQDWRKIVKTFADKINSIDPEETDHFGYRAFDGYFPE